MVKVSAVLVVHNEERHLEECLSCLSFADEIVVVLDNCTDGSAEIAARFAHQIVEGSWPLEGPRRHAGIDVAKGPWILEVDADERVSPEMGREIRTLADSEPSFDYVMMLVDNYIGGRLVRYGWGASFGKRGSMALYRKGHKVWGNQRVHPTIKLSGERGPDLQHPLQHFVASDVSELIQRLNSYTSARAADMRDKNERGSIPNEIRRVFSRGLRSYIFRKGYKEVEFGLFIAILGGLYPLLSTLKARLDPKFEADQGSKGPNEP